MDIQQMTEDIVPAQAAMFLKELGFNVPCKAFFVGGQCYTLNSLSYNSLFENKSEQFSAPTIQTALKWLRNEKNVFIEVRTEDSKFKYKIKTRTQNKWSTYWDNLTLFDTYEDAICDALIEFLLRLAYDERTNKTTDGRQPEQD